MLKLLGRLAVIGALAAAVYAALPDIKRYVDMTRI